MSSDLMVTEMREVRDFQRVILRDYGDLVITQGSKEKLTIETSEDMLKLIQTDVRGDTLDIRIGASWIDKLGYALRSTLTREPLHYHLVVNSLTGLEILGAARVDVESLDVDQLSLVLGGAGSINLRSLNTQRLAVEIRGAGKIEASGEIVEQWVTIDGAGGYHAPRLGSMRAMVQINGVGKATLSVKESLAVAIHGLGSVDYYGPAEIQKNASGLGSVTHLGNP
jgi:hypothetical protein